MPSIAQIHACGRRRSPATFSSFHQGRPPRNKGQHGTADPPTVEEIVAVMHAAGEDNEVVRLRGLIVLWRAGLRISEALALTESDRDLHRGAILVRHAAEHSRASAGRASAPSSDHRVDADAKAKAIASRLDGSARSGGPLVLSCLCAPPQVPDDSGLTGR